MTFIFSTLFFIFLLMMMTPLYVLANANIQESYTHAIIGVAGLGLMLAELAFLSWLDDRQIQLNQGEDNE